MVAGADVSSPPRAVPPLSFSVKVKVLSVAGGRGRVLELAQVLHRDRQRQARRGDRIALVGQAAAGDQRDAGDRDGLQRVGSGVVGRIVEAELRGIEA